MNRIETTMGVLKYRYPTIIETISMVRSLREFFTNEDNVGAKLSIMEKLEPMLDYSEMNGIKSFEDLNKHGEEMTGKLYEIADVILKKVVGAFEKKQ